MASAARAARRDSAIQSARESPDWPSALISLSMSYSTRRIASVAPSIKRYDANLPTMICAYRLAPAVLFSIGCAGLPAATRRCCDPCAAATSEISPSHSPAGSGRVTPHSYKGATRVGSLIGGSVHPGDAAGAISWNAVRAIVRVAHKELPRGFPRTVGYYGTHGH